MILEFTDESKAQACLDQVTEFGRQVFAGAGYQVINGEVVGRTNGVDDLSAQRITKWDDVKVSPDGTYYFRSPRDKWPEHHAALVAGFEGQFTERAFPDAWKEEI